MNVASLPTETAAGGWHDERHTKKKHRLNRFSGFMAVPWVVVGGGFSGLAAARRLAEHYPGEQIVLVDALEIGQGSSGRNCGFVLPIGHFEGDWESDHNARLYRLGTAGIDALRRLVDRHQIDCDWDETGRLIGARGRFALRSLQHKRKVLTRLGAPWEDLPVHRLTEITGLQGYLAAIRQADSVLVQPAALVRGLYDSLPANVQVFEQSPVLQFDRARGSVRRLRCPHGQIETEKVLLTTGGHVNSFGLARIRVFPMRTFASLAQLPAAGVAGGRFGSGNWGLTSARRIGSSLRRLPGDRILIRNSAAYGIRAGDPQRELQCVAKIHGRTLRNRFPNAGTWEIQRTWSGVISVSANGAGWFGQMDRNVWAIAGHNGHGIAHGTIAGQLLADLAVGHGGSLLEDIQKLPTPAWIPGGPLLRAGVAATIGYLNCRGRHEI